MSEQKQEKILLVIADTTFGDQVNSALKKNGYNTVLVKTGMEGLKTMNEIEPNLVILDVTLTDMDSYVFLEKKMDEPFLANIPLYLVSSQGVPINMRRVPQNSVTEFLMALHIDATGIVDKVNRQFGHEAEAITDSSGAAKKKVLWVEDDKLIGSILSKKLISSGFDLFHAKSGEEAIEALQHVIPDVIILDLLLPGMNGFDVLQKIKADGGLKKVPVLILSNLSKPSDIERAKLLGVDRFLIKATASLEQIVQEVRSMS